MSKCSQGCSGEARWAKGNSGWHSSPVDATSHISSIARQDFDLLLLFASANALRTCEACRAEYSSACSIPAWWWDDYMKSSNGYFGFEDWTDADGSSGTCAWLRLITKDISDTHATNTQLRYTWNKVNAFVRWSRQDKSVIILVFDALRPLQERTTSSLADIRSGGPVWILAFFVGETVRWQDRSVNAVRNHVRTIEKHRLLSRAHVDFYWLHELLRHAIHVVETLQVAEAVSLDLLGWCERLEVATERTNPELQTDLQRSGARLSFHKSVLRSLLARAEATKERLSNEMGLAHNLIAQSQSRASTDIALAAKVDSSAMKRIAFVTAALLPATFVATLFSTTFFSFGDEPGSWSVSDKFWIYWVVTVPMTILPSGLWFFYDRVERRKGDSARE